MIYLKARRSTEPVKSDGFIVRSSEVCTLPVIKIRKHQYFGYQALVVYPKYNAPHDIYYSGDELWVHFIKNKQVGLKLPMLDIGQEINV